MNSFFSKCIKTIKKLLARFRGQKYGWIPQPIDSRDLILVLKNRVYPLPNSVDLRAKCPEIWNQGRLGSCTAHGVAFAHRFMQAKQRKKNIFAPSRLAIYYDARKRANGILSDSGTHIRDGIKVIAKIGVASEELWPYTVSKFNERPSPEYYTEALKSQGVAYRSVCRELKDIKSCLSDGYPIVFGFNVYKSFESRLIAETGVMENPKEGEEIVGGHCAAFVGYNEIKKVFICRNSWGAKWGDAGYFYMPYDFALRETSDLWTLRGLE